MKKQILKLQRREVRYFLYRLRTSFESDGAVEAPTDAMIFGSYYEALTGFDGWLNFARSWDLGPEGRHHEIVKRLHTEEQEWNVRLAGISRTLPIN